MKGEHQFFVLLGVNSEIADAFLALIREEVLHENSLDRIGEKSTLDYQRGKVAVLRHLESLAQNSALKREKRE